jgi:protein-disulfide isomerase
MFGKSTSRFLIAVAIALGATLPVSTLRAEISEKDFTSAMDRYLKSDGGQEAIGNALQAYSVKMRERAMTEEFERQFANPVKIEAGDSPSKGPANAKITIIEFSDFQCPYCKRGKDTMDQVVKAFPNDVRLVFKHLPLPMHPEAKPAARATFAAAKQGKFWEMHDALFDNQANLNSEFYTKTAEKLGLNMEKFKADMESPEASKAVDADMELGQKNGIQGTPGFFVNGVAVKGAYPFEHFKKIIERLLATPAKK